MCYLINVTRCTTYYLDPFSLKELVLTLAVIFCLHAFISFSKLEYYTSFMPLLSWLILEQIFRKFNNLGIISIVKHQILVGTILTHHFITCLKRVLVLYIEITTTITKAFEVHIVCMIFVQHTQSLISWVRDRVSSIGVGVHIRGTTYLIKIWSGVYGSSHNRFTEL